MKCSATCLDTNTGTPFGVQRVGTAELSCFMKRTKESRIEPVRRK
jgi:hypothetical protein